MVDRAKLASDLMEFYNFKGKSVIYVGAGGKQILNPACRAKKIVAVDSDPRSLEGFRKAAKKSPWSKIPIRFVARPFETVAESSDVVYFEFCLHLMKSPRSALAHARSLAREILVLEHLRDSEWIYLAAEERKVERAEKAIESRGARRSANGRIFHTFADYGELRERLSGQGKVSLKRILRFNGKQRIPVAMDYGLFLL